MRCEDSWREGGTNCPPYFIRVMITKELIDKIVNDTIRDTGMFVVAIQVLAGSRIEVVLDSDTNITIDDCVKVSRSIEASLDRDKEDFELSVYSAGLSEPLKLERQYLKHIGKEVEVLLKTGTKQIGELLSIKDGTIKIKFQKKEKTERDKRKKLVDYTCELDLADIKSTKLVIKV